VFPHSSEALDHGGFFDSINRPYTPSYNSTSGFEGALSDQDDYWSGAGSQLDGVDFDFAQEISKSQGHTTSFDYDPETADNYNNLESALLAAQSFASNETSPHNQQSQGINNSVPKIELPDSNSFRDPIEKSPIASPLLGATSPFHTRHSSFGSNVGSPTQALDSELNWMQSLGQRMSLREDGPNQHHSFHHPHALQQQNTLGGHPSFAPVFEEEGGEDQNDRQSIQPFPSYTYSQQPSGSQSQSGQDVRQQSGNASVPMLSINDTTMQDDGSAAHGGKEDGRNWQNAANWYQNTNDFSSLNSYTNSSQSLMGDLAQSNPAPPPSNTRFGGDAQGRMEPKRQDSYDPIRKFLRLDVDMGFVSQQQQDQSISGDGYQGAASRKRSNSDFGPSFFGAKEGGEGTAAATSPPLFTVVPGGVTDKTPTALTSGVDWVTETARQRKLQAAQAQGSMNNNDTIVLTMQQNGNSMDPNLLQHQHPNTQQPRYNPASGPMRQRDVSNVRGGAGPYQHNRTSSSGTANATPWAPLSPSVPSPLLPNSFAHPEGSGSSASQMASRSLRRSQSASRHRRGAQSEDLSQLARSSNPTEFLNRITAPDGSLAPPNSTSIHPASMGYQNSFANSTSTDSSIPNSQSLMNPFRVSHDRHHSTGSNRSTSSLGSGGDGNEAFDQQMGYQSPSSSRYGTMRSQNGQMESPARSSAAAAPRIYSQTALPTYTSLSTPPNSNSIMATSMPSNDGPIGSVPYPIVQVTTSATQAASASRRKNEAIHVCPIPGCGSTFTRKFNLNGHIRSHTGARPYECREPGCGKSFARSFDLSRHEKLHAGIKPHNCESCGKAFARADALSRHLRNDAGNGGCAARFQEGEEDSRMSITPAPRFRSGSSASSSLESQDELERLQENGRKANTGQQGNDREAHQQAKRETRFKGYVL